MTPSQLDHLSRIKRHLETLLANAEKRTPGEWGSDEGQYVCADDHGVAECYHRDSDENDHNAAFIAACAGNAEAGWESTLAAIEWALFMHQNGQVGEGLLEKILAAWPIKKLP